MKNRVKAGIAVAVAVSLLILCVTLLRASRLESEEINCADWFRGEILTQQELSILRPVAWDYLANEIGVYALDAEFVSRLPNGTIHLLARPRWPRDTNVLHGVVFSPKGKVLKTTTRRNDM